MTRLTICPMCVGLITLAAGCPTAGGGSADSNTNGNDSGGGPAVDAGSDQTVEPGDLVGLCGSTVGFPSGEPLTFLWAQVDGAPVDLNGEGLASTSFAAPLFEDSLEFVRTVGDDDDSASDSIVVTVVFSQ